MGSRSSKFVNLVGLGMSRISMIWVCEEGEFMSKAFTIFNDAVTAKSVFRIDIILYLWSL